MNKYPDDSNLNNTASNKNFGNPEKTDLYVPGHQTVYKIKSILNKPRHQNTVNNEYFKEISKRSIQNNIQSDSNRTDKFGTSIIYGGKKKHKVTFMENNKIHLVSSYKSYNSMEIETSCCLIF